MERERRATSEISNDSQADSLPERGDSESKRTQVNRPMPEAVTE